MYSAHMRSILHDRDRAVPRTRKGALVALAFCSSVLGVACGGDGDDAAPPPPPTGTIIIANENNYSSEASLTIPTIDVAAATDLTIDWSGLIRDLQCHNVAPGGGVKMLTLLRFPKTEEQVEERLVGGPIAGSELRGIFTLKPGGGTTGSLAAFDNLSGQPINLGTEFSEDEDITYLLIAATGDSLGVGAASMVFLRPTEAESETTVTIGEGCGTLSFTADLAENNPAEVPASAPYIVDWSDLEVDGQGLPINRQSIDRLLLGFYPNMSVSDLEMDIFDIETLANPLWEMPISGTSANLAQARERTSSGAGAAFSSFDQGQGTWMIALTCSTCQNPQPIVLTILEPSAP